MAEAPNVQEPSAKEAELRSINRIFRHGPSTKSGELHPVEVNTPLDEMRS